jgi:hypothetical protein
VASRDDERGIWSVHGRTESLVLVLVLALALLLSLLSW